MIRDKKGIVFTAGIIAILSALSLIAIAILLVFVSVNKFAVLGAALIIITLIFGLKGNFNRQKSIFMIAIIGMGLFLFMGGDMLQTQFGPEPSHIFLDNELGLIETHDDTVLTEQAYFKSTSGTHIIISNVGETVYICDIFAQVSGYKYVTYDWATSKDGSTISHQDLASTANSRTSYCRSWIPLNEGKYEVISHFLMCPDIIGPVQESDCLQRSSDDVKSYFLTVNAIEDRCDKSTYIGDWFVNEYIDNGQVLRANVYYVNLDCEYYVSRYQEQTQCDDGYVIEGTTLHSTSDSGYDCEKIPTLETDDTETIDEDNNNIDDSYDNIDENCNTDLLVECGDGTTITSKICSEGFLFDTGAKCSTIGIPDSELPENINEKLITISPITGDVIEEVTQPSIIGTSFFEEYKLYLIALAFIIIIGGLFSLKKYGK